MGLMAGKQGLIMGVANERSIAWGIARALHAKARGSPSLFRATRSASGSGRWRKASTAISCWKPTLPPRPASIAVRFIGRTLGPARFRRARDRVLRQERADRQIRRDEPGEFPAHAGDFVLLVHRCVPRAVPLMSSGGSLLTLTYAGAERVIAALQCDGRGEGGARSQCALSRGRSRRDNIRVNAISAGPIKTLAASGIGDFRYILKWNQLNSPLQRNVTIEDVGGAGLYLLSDLSAGLPARFTTSIAATTSSA